MPALRGRAAQSLRPGHLIKGILSGRAPLIVAGKEDLVREACITDLHITYRELTKRENQLRPKDKQLRGMTSESFHKLFRFAKLMGLVTKVREEPMLFPPPEGQLYFFEKTNHEVALRPTARTIYSLTPDGEAEGIAWGNLCRAWSEAWEIPRAAVVEVPVVEVPPVPVPRKVLWKPFKYIGSPSKHQFNLLDKHLQRLQTHGIDAPGVREEVDRVRAMCADWEVELAYDIERARAKKPIDKEYIKVHEAWHDRLSLVTEALEDDNLDLAVENIGKLVVLVR